MRSVGAKPSFVAKTMVAEGLGLGLKAGVPAALLASLFSIYGLIPDATIPSLLYLPEMIVLILLSLVGTVLLASIPVYLIFKGQSGLRVSEFAT
jgi:predicted lysophospholipase L1 biosynthesis ABC-type transport system permease subunit